MLVYHLRGDPAFTMMKPILDQSWPLRGGELVTEPWTEIEFTPADGDEGSFIALDCLTMNTGADGLLYSTHVMDLLTALLAKSGRFWPVNVLGQRYWWHNCTAIVGAFDRAPDRCGLDRR
jgi:hypothetical protein